MNNESWVGQVCKQVILSISMAVISGYFEIYTKKKAQNLHFSNKNMTSGN